MRASSSIVINPNREPTLDELVRDYLGTVPPRRSPRAGRRIGGDAGAVPPSEVPRDEDPRALGRRRER